MLQIAWVHLFAELFVHARFNAGLHGLKVRIGTHQDGDKRSSHAKQDSTVLWGDDHYFATAAIAASIALDTVASIILFIYS